MALFIMTASKLLPVLGLALLACTPNNIARQASRAAVDEGAEQLTKESTQDTLQEAAEDPKIRAATSEMTESISEGVLRALESERARTQISAMTRSITQAAVQQLVASLGQEQTRQSLAGLTRGVTDAALEQVASSLQTDFRPAVRSMLQEDLATGMAAALRSQELQPALGQTAQTVAYNAMLGANNGLGAAWQGQEGMLGTARGLPSVTSTLLWPALIGMGLLSLMFVSGAVMMVARARHAHAEVARLESATLLLATAMRERQATEQTDEILAVVQSALEGRAEKSGTHRILDALKLRKSA
jgi:hypothetical protein